ncbi:acyltransferase family protein [Mucilaginibacter flavus]|uniref:acyltransferase family protein n=1 Tax=Mucilaginibacter flavus TaxID=931504 RepID=UPI0025B54F0C|nr:acyltransferase [Mucilaginibacter flavus]MDN3579910.1 acyltransferase [Mucilaginibacter flavus]
MSTSAMPDNLVINNKHKLAGLDHLRALAITLVFFYHYQLFGHPEWEGRICEFGWTGVDLFFVLSGFLIAGQLFATIARRYQISLKQFFIKRFFRIIPAYLVMVGLYSFAPFLREGEGIAPVWKYLTFTLNYGLDRRYVGTFTHAWSLCVEEQFYLSLPLIILLCRYLKVGKKITWLFPLLFIAGFAVREWCWRYQALPNLKTEGAWTKYIYYPTHNRLDGLLIGVAIAGLFTFWPQIKLRVNNHGNLLLATGLVLLAASYFVTLQHSDHKASVYGYPLVSLAFGFIVAGAVCPSCILYKRAWWLTSQIATLSYSIYLVHKMMIHLTQVIGGYLGMDVNGNLMFLLCIISSISGALLMRYLVEKPFLKLRDRVLKS